MFIFFATKNQLEKYAHFTTDVWNLKKNELEIRILIKQI